MRWNKFLCIYRFIMMKMVYSKLAQRLINMIITQQDLLSLLDTIHISYKVYQHPPVFTAAEAMLYCSEIPGAHVKNLFLRDKKKSQYLLCTIQENKQVDLKALAELLNVGRLSFASDQDLIAKLGVQPGSVTPLAILNDSQGQIKFLMDAALEFSEYINVHPMENTATLHLKTRDLLAFIESRYDRGVNLIEIPTIK
jgi:Ala-tRNA(Pro) deacylase